MGTSCSQKRKNTAIKQKQFSKMPLSDSAQTLHVENNIISPQQTIKQYKQLCVLLELIDTIDILKSKTLDLIQQLYGQKNNCDIIIQNTIRRNLRKKNLIRPPLPEDENLLLEDKKFIQLLHTQLVLTAEIIRTLQNDINFQDKYPTICVQFIELAESIQ